MMAAQFGRLGVIGIIVAALVGPSAGARSETAEPVAVQVAGQGWPWLSAGDGRPVPMAFGGTTLSAEALGTPQALAAGDFDEDGVPDLVSAYAGVGGGFLVLHRGNVDSIYPEAPEAQARRAAGTFTAAPFLPAVRAFSMPEAPAFLAVGDFDNDGHLDVVTAAAGGTRLWWRRGDGHGGLGAPEAIALDGGVTALAVGEMNRADELQDLGVAIAGRDGAHLLVFESSLGALRGQPEVFGLPAPAGALALGHLVGDPLPDLAVAAGTELLILHGRDRRLSEDDEAQAIVRPARVTRLPLGRVVTGLAIGHFTRGDTPELALLGVDGTLSVMAPGAGPQPRAPALLAVGPWRAGARLVRANASALPLDDLVIVDPATRELHVLNAGDPRRRAEPIRVAWEVAGAPVAALPMRLNGDALSDLVVLQAGTGPEVAAILTDPAQTFTVNSSADDGDENPGDKLCKTVERECTLRAAIEEANALPGETQIVFAIRGIVKTVGNLRTSAPVVLDGSTDSRGPLLELNGGGAKVPGFVLDGGRSTVRGLGIVSFDDGIRLQAGSGHKIERNRITSNRQGVTVGTGSTHNTIGGTAASARNVIAHNDVVDPDDPRGYGVWLRSASNQVHGNYIGLDWTGSTADGNRVGVVVDVPDNVIGGTAATGGARNVISGNLSEGVRVRADRTQVLNNYIGTDDTGSTPVGNQVGVFVKDVHDTRIGRPSAGNVISGNGQGIYLSCRFVSCVGTLIQGNKVGTNAAGSARLPNRTGVFLIGGPATVGGAVVGAGNVISGNFEDGVHISSWASGDSTDHKVQGNIIGPGQRLQPGIGNDGRGISVVASGAKLGGSTAAGNIVAFNGSAGILVDKTAQRVSILSNRVFSNGRRAASLGIDLWPPGVNPIGRDGQRGANFWQSFPELSRATTDGRGTVTVEGILRSRPFRFYAIQLFRSRACDKLGYGEGETLLVERIVVRTNALQARIRHTFRSAVPVGAFVTATATDPDGNTSEFSKCVKVEHA